MTSLHQEAPTDTATTVPGPPLPRLGGRWTARVARSEGADLDLVHGWMHSPHIEAFWHQAWPVERWEEEISGHLAGDAILPVLVDLDGDPFAYIEVYRVARDRLADYYPYWPRDLGLHIAIGEQSRTGRGLGRELLRALVDGLLSADPSCRRVVAEPDLTNEPSLRAFAAAGFHEVARIELPEKKASLMFHPREERDLAL
ncbi:GNAT family N-acetyltransferase [Streptomyces sp. NPDC006798]|uniref:GNAT family N-acetyltransferase n=1 Tax=Streptomyces sp. NPDC006798 TaxID=3155462 RepID=UPI0033DCE99B